MRSECIRHKCKTVAIKSDGWVDGSQFRSATNWPPHQMQDEKLSGTHNVVIMCYGARGKKQPRGSVITPMDTNSKEREAEGWSSEESRGIANEGRLKQRETNAGCRIEEKIRSSDPLPASWKLISSQGRCEKIPDQAREDKGSSIYSSWLCWTHTYHNILYNRYHREELPKKIQKMGTGWLSPWFWAHITEVLRGCVLTRPEATEEEEGPDNRLRIKNHLFQTYYNIIFQYHGGYVRPGN